MLFCRCCHCMNFAMHAVLGHSSSSVSSLAPATLPATLSTPAVSTPLTALAARPAPASVARPTAARAAYLLTTDRRTIHLAASIHDHQQSSHLIPTTQPRRMLTAGQQELPRPARQHWRQQWRRRWSAGQVPVHQGWQGGPARRHRQPGQRRRQAQGLHQPAQHTARPCHLGRVRAAQPGLPRHMLLGPQNAWTAGGHAVTLLHHQGGRHGMCDAAVHAAGCCKGRAANAAGWTQHAANPPA